MDHTIKQWKELWNIRNSLVHGKTLQEIQRHRRDKAFAELDYIYQRRHLYLPKDQSLLFEDILEHKKLPLLSIQNWLLMYKKYLQDSAKLARKRALKGVSRITKFFKKK